MNAPYREAEEKTVQFAPTEAKDFDLALNQGVAKVLGVSDDLALVGRAEKAIQDDFQKCAGGRSIPQLREFEPREGFAMAIESLILCQPIQTRALVKRRQVQPVPITPEDDSNWECTCIALSTYCGSGGAWLPPQVEWNQGQVAWIGLWHLTWDEK